MGAPGIQTSANFGSLVDLDPVLTQIFYQHLGELDPMLEVLFRVQDSDKSKETDQRVGSFGDPEEFTGNLVYDGADADYSIAYTHTQFASGFRVERTLLDDMQYASIFEKPEDLARSYKRKVEKDAASVFNNGFSTAGYDSVSLCSTTHPRSLADSTAVSNSHTAALTDANLDAARIIGDAMTDDRGELINSNWDLLLVPTGLKKTAHELTASMTDPESGNGANNMWNGTLRYLSWNRLTDANNWFLIDTQAMKRYLKWFWRIRPEFGAEDEFDTFQRKYRGYMRYSYGWSDFRWVVGANV